MSAAAEPRRRPELRRHRWLLALVILIVLCIVSALLQPKFFRLAVIESNLTSFLPLILVAIGQTYVILAGDIDLSVGSIIAVVNVSVVQAITALGGEGMAIPLALLLGLGIGVTCGAVNGLCVAWLRFQPIVTTFATGDRVSSVGSLEEVVAVAAVDLVVSRPGQHAIVAGAGVDRVISFLGADRIVATIAHDRVIAAAGGNGVDR